MPMYPGSGRPGDAEGHHREDQQRDRHAHPHVREAVAHQQEEEHLQAPVHHRERQDGRHLPPTAQRVQPAQERLEESSDPIPDPPRKHSDEPLKESGHPVREQTEQDEEGDRDRQDGAQEDLGVRQALQRLRVGRAHGGRSQPLERQDQEDHDGAHVENALQRDAGQGGGGPQFAFDGHHRRANQFPKARDDAVGHEADHDRREQRAVARGLVPAQNHLPAERFDRIDQKPGEHGQRRIAPVRRLKRHFQVVPVPFVMEGDGHRADDDGDGQKHENRMPRVFHLRESRFQLRSNSSSMRPSSSRGRPTTLLKLPSMRSTKRSAVSWMA